MKTLDTAPTVVCVLGMHRSGTSLIARALDCLGVYFGKDAHMMKPREDNPGGFSEHQLLTDLNDEILWRLGGSWHAPPTLPAGWEAGPALDGLRTRAQQLLDEEFGSARVWGWKDPRSCLTLPFWQQLIPSMRYVVCVRSPLDVARSLRLRDAFPREKAVGLWLRYMRDALVHTSGFLRLFVSYDDVIDRQESEVGRMAAFIGGSAPDSTASTALAAIDGTLRHHVTTDADLARDAKTSFRAQAVYVSLKLLIELQRNSTAPDRGFPSLVEILSDHASHAETSAQEPLLQDQIVEMKWVAHHAVAEAERLGRALSTQETELTVARRMTDEVRSELRASTLQVRALEDERAELGQTVSQVQALERQRATLLAELARFGGLELEHEDLRQQLSQALALEEHRQSLAAHLSYLETPAGCTRLALRTFLPPRAYARVRRVYRQWIAWRR